MKGGDEIATEHRGRILCMLVHQAHDGLVIRRSQKINHQYRSAGLRTTRSRSPQQYRIGKMMQEAITDHRIEFLPFQRGVREVSILERDPTSQTSRPNTPQPK